MAGSETNGASYRGSESLRDATTAARGAAGENPLPYLVTKAVLALARRRFPSFADEFVHLVALRTHPRRTWLPRRSKGGTFSFKVTGRVFSFKLYSCIDDRWAEHVCRASAHLLSRRVRVPEILARSGKYILARWIEGRDIRDQVSCEWSPLHEAMVRYQASMHNAGLPAEPASSLSYVEEYLVPRFDRHAAGWLSRNERRRVTSFVGARVRDLRETGPRISQPDFSPFNLVADDNGLVMIDNENVHIGRHWEFDVLNTAISVFGERGLKERYLREYGAIVDIRSLTEQRDFWDAVWLIRVIGGRLQDGAPSGMEPLVQDLCRRTRSLSASAGGASDRS